MGADTPEDYLYLIANMDEWVLLNEVLNNPEYLADSYYHRIAEAIHNRFDKLKKLNGKRFDN